MEAMREAAAAISDVDPGARLPLPPAEDEVHRLGVTLNGMLERLEHARDREREFFSDASHELRTPLTILKTEVDIALRKENPPEALRAALRVAGAETDRLINLAEDLLSSRAATPGRWSSTAARCRRAPDRGRRAPLSRPRPGERPRAHGPSRPTTSPSTSTAADRQALSNLVENALPARLGAASTSPRQQRPRRAARPRRRPRRPPRLPAARVRALQPRADRAHRGRHRARPDDRPAHRPGPRRAGGDRQPAERGRRRVAGAADPCPAQASG